jgi:1-acyl-sn-glycerol-3-phosphate acyltransferase
VNVFVAAPHTSLVDGFALCADRDARLPAFLVKVIPQTLAEILLKDMLLLYFCARRKKKDIG